MLNIPDPILRAISTDGTTIDLLGHDSGWELSDPYWNPQVAQFKGGGAYVNSALADGQRLVSARYDNVTESVPLSVRGYNQAKALETINDLLALGRQSSDYYTRSYEFDNVYLEVKPACNDCLSGYARLLKLTIPELGNPFGQPFFSANNVAVMEDITLIIEREPLWRGVPPGEVIGPLYNLLKNPDFELWSNGIIDAQPDSWNDLETTHITGQNSRADDPHSGQYSLKIRVSSSTGAGRFKGISQIVTGFEGQEEHTAIAWVRSEGVSNGVGRILITYSDQTELYRNSDRHGWQLYAATFTPGVEDTVAISCEILTTAANTDGTIYIDSLMIVLGVFNIGSPLVMVGG